MARTTRRRLLLILGALTMVMLVASAVVAVNGDGPCYMRCKTKQCEVWGMACSNCDYDETKCEWNSTGCESITRIPGGCPGGIIE